MISKQVKAEFLSVAMPYIKKYNEKSRAAVEYNGNAMINEKLKSSVFASVLQTEKSSLILEIYRLLGNIKQAVISGISCSFVCGIVFGCMIPKIDRCKKAIRFGVQKAFIIDGRVNHSIFMELFSIKMRGQRV